MEKIPWYFLNKKQVSTSSKKSFLSCNFVIAHSQHVIHHFSSFQIPSAFDRLSGSVYLIYNSFSTVVSCDHIFQTVFSPWIYYPQLRYIFCTWINDTTTVKLITISTLSLQHFWGLIHTSTHILVTSYDSTDTACRERFCTIWCVLFQQEQKEFKEHMAESIWFLSLPSPTIILVVVLVVVWCLVWHPLQVWWAIVLLC